MKKTAFVIVLIILIQCLAPIAGATGLADVPNFTEAIHTKTEEYPADFPVFLAQDETFTLSIQQSVYKKLIAKLIWDNTAADLEQIAQTLQTELAAPEVYIVSQATNGTVEAIGSRVYCTRKDIGSPAYRRALLGAALGTQEPWILWGAEAYVFGGTWDQEALKEYCQSAETPDMLSLFAAYFCDAFWGETQLAQDMASAVSSYIIERYGIGALVENGQSYIQEWLASIGVDRVYDNPYAGLFNGYRYTSTDQYPFVVVSDRGDIYYFTLGEGNIETVEEIEIALADAALGTRAILARIREEAPEYYEVVCENYARPIYYYFVSERDVSYVDRGRTIYLLISDSLLHETVHVMVPKLRSKARWQYEAIATYLSRSTYAVKGEQIRYFHVLQRENAGNSADDQIGRLTQEFFSRAAMMPERPEDVDVIAFMRSMTQAIAALPDLDFQSVYFVDTFAEIRTGTKQIVYEGDELTYAQCMLLADYLVDRYGLSSLLRYGLEPRCSFDDIYKVSFPEMRQRWWNESIVNVTLD